MMKPLYASVSSTRRPVASEKLSAAALTFTRKTNDEDALNTTVINQKGTVLPETGGMGTTILYILGAVLVIGAGVVLVTRKKANDR